ncbi:MAG: YaaA family protein [Micromonosporaceae bacterium]
MLVLLPPSETKADGGDGPPLDLDALSYPELTPTRRRLVDALVAVAEDVPASLKALGLTERQTAEVERNRMLPKAPTLPALLRYTGVLYDALDVGAMSRAERRRAEARLAVGSALFGVVRGADPVPAYRLSGGTVLPGLDPLRTLWRPVLGPALADTGLLIDLRSAAYAQLGAPEHAVTVRVVDGERRIAVSHFNKAHKGRLARMLATAPRVPSTVTGLLRTARNAGFRLERTGERTLDLIV